jgi:ligand-binding sensor domain-containing protein/signal transduction histidine kinase
MKKKSCTLFLLLLNAGFVFAQSNLYFRHFTDKQGLSQNTVSCITQDNFGFIWFGTEDGLNRYNGYNVDVFKHDPSDNRTISQSNIRCMFEDNDDALWIGTDDGLNLFERTTETFVHYRYDFKNSNSISSNVISGITQDKNGLLWIGTNNGLNSFDVKNNKWTVYKHDDKNPSSLSSNNITCVAIDNSDNLWIGTDGEGVNRFNISSRKFSTYKNNPADNHSLSENDVTTIYCDRASNVWMGTINEGLNKFENAGGTFTRYQNDPANANSISQNSVLSICEDAQGTLWIGTLDQGLNAFNKITGNFISYKNNSLDNCDNSSISSNRIWSIYADRAGALWIGTKNGVSILDKSLKRFETVNFNSAGQNSSVYSIFEDSQGTLWFGMFGDGLISAPKNSPLKKYLHADSGNPNSISNNNVFSICEDKDGLLWIGTLDGLNTFDKKTEKFTVYKNNSNDKSSLSNNYVRTVYCAPSGIVWIGTYGGGLNSFNKATGKFTVYKNDPSNPNSLSNDIVYSIFSDHTSSLWIGTYGGGLCLLDSSSGNFTTYKNDLSNFSSLSNNFIHCITQDRAGTIWVGTYGGGLNAFDNVKKTFLRYTERDGLINNIINGIVPDVNGNLWVSTSKGLCRFKLPIDKRNSVRTYDSQDGAQDKYNEGAFLKLKNGKMFFGGTAGYNAFFPDDVKDNPYLPPVVITRFYLFEKPHTMDTMITSKRTVELSYRQNFFSFEFAGLNYTFPEKNQYAYMMEPLDKAWNYSGNRRYAAYTNIDPGEYIFRVKACNNDGIWNEQGTFLRITINPPFYKTWWFSILAGIIIATSIVLYIRFRTSNLLQQNILLENKVQQRTSELKEKNEELVTTMDHLKSTQDQLIQSEKMASLGQLTAGIAHEIQNPLNFVNNFSIVSAELLDDLQHATPQEAPLIANDLKTNLQKITHHGKRAERIVKGMLMHSRTGTPEKTLTDVNKLIEDSLNLAYTGIHAKDKNFKCEIKTNFNLSLPHVDLVPQDISRVILNLINNAFYAMNEKSNQAADHSLQKEKKTSSNVYVPVLTLSTANHDKYITIGISDNGPGIPKKIQDQIFQPFFTTKPAGEGTGLGLSLSYDIITKGHNGTIAIESEPGKTTFIIDIPVS